jgi:uncharacterized protein YjlB
LVLYRSAIPDAGDRDAAGRFERLFRGHGWGGIWVDGIYPFHHYHAVSHEVLGITRGSVQVQFGRSMGLGLQLTAGDSALISAGVAHGCQEAHGDLSVVGA